MHYYTKLVVDCSSVQNTQHVYVEPNNEHKKKGAQPCESLTGCYRTDRVSASCMCS